MVNSTPTAAQTTGTTVSLIGVPEAPGVIFLYDANCDGVLNTAEAADPLSVRIDLTNTGAAEGDIVTVNGVAAPALTATDITNEYVDVTVPSGGAQTTVNATITDSNNNTSPTGSASSCPI